MVKILSIKDKELLHEATAKAEAKTKAEIVTIILPASDTYAHYMMLCGFIFGSVVDVFLWYKKIWLGFPSLLSVQIMFAMLWPLIPGALTVTLKLLPKKIYHHRAAQVAAEKRLAASKNASSKTPILVIFISLAEHYIHIFPNTLIREKIADEKWRMVVNDLVKNIQGMRLADACVKAIEQSSTILIENKV